MAVIADNCPSLKVTVVDINEERIKKWNDNDIDNLPVYEPGLAEIVKRCRNKNLFFSIDIKKNIESADMIFLSVNTPIKKSGLGKGKANLYILPDIDVEHIYELAEQLDELYEEYEFLWSHPEYTKGGDRAAPVPVLIQQDRELLEYLRGSKQKKA